MKKYLTFTLMAVLISLLAVSVYAQEKAGEQPKNNEQVRNETRTGDAVQDGDIVRTRTRSTTGTETKSLVADKAGEQPQNCDQVRNENRTGDAVQDGDIVRIRTRSSSSTETKSFAADKDGVDTGVRARGTSENSDAVNTHHALGENNMHGDGTPGPWGDVSVSSSNDKAGVNDLVDGEFELGNNNRNGEEFVQDREAHGPFGLDNGDMFDATKASDSFGGSQLGDLWGPGERLIGGHFGPNDGVGFGAGVIGIESSGSKLEEIKGPSRAGRR